MKISLKTKVVNLGGWRSRLEPVDAICGVNDTGSYSDSPCPTAVGKEELSLVTKILRKNKIKYRKVYLHTSNVFCLARYVIVAEQDKPTAIELIEHLPAQTRLLYLC